MAIILRQDAEDAYYENPNYCKECNKMILLRKSERVSQTKRKKFCNQSCAATFHNKGRIKKERKPKKERIPKIRFERLLERTKGDLFSSMKWQSARTTIRFHANYVYEKSEKLKKCNVCGYDKHYEVCHKKAVSEFDRDTKVKEINHIDNLIGLCPNCHWEFDNGTKIDELNKTGG